VNLDTQFAQLIKVVGDTKLTFYSLELTVSDSVQGICGPRIVPVNGTAVSDGWELSAPISELFTNGRESKDDVEVFSANLNEVSKDLVSVVAHVFSPSSGANLFANSGLVFWWEQLWHLTRVNQVVDILEEALLDNLSIREQEANLFIVSTSCSKQGT
jgi:hypothetical protein